MNLRDPTSMNVVLSNVLRYGVLLSAAIIVFGTALLITREGFASVEGFVVYNPNQVPHGTFAVSLGAMAQGLLVLDPFAVIELGVLALLATPVARVLFSAFLFAVEGDRTYVYITAMVLLLLLFSMLVTPFIPGFNG